MRPPVARSSSGGKATLDSGGRATPDSGGRARPENWARFNGENCKIFAKKSKDSNMVRNQRKFGAAFRPSPSPQCGFLPQHARTCNQMQPPTQTRAPTHTRTNTQAHRQALAALLEYFFRLGERAYDTAPLAQSPGSSLNSTWQLILLCK